MALLGRIRQYGVVMMVLIVIAVFGFLFMDISSVGRGFGGPSNVLGSVNGTNITRDDIEAYVDEFKGMGYKDDEQTRAAAWNEIVTDLIFKAQSKKLGMSISDKELSDMFVGENLSPVVVNAFGGQADRAQIEQSRNDYLQRAKKSISKLNEQERVFVNSFKNLENKAMSERLASKYLNMLSKSNYTPTWMTNSEYTRNSRNYDFKYVSVLYSDVPNSEVKVSDDDMKAYIKENAKKYQKEANVSLEYITFDITPTQEDSTIYLAKMTKIAEDFKTATNDTMFAASNKGNLDTRYTTKADFADADTHKIAVFAKTKGDVYGPYIDNYGNYKVVKIIETKDMPDSVKCRQIFRPANARDINSLRSQKVLLDSLVVLLKTKKANFDSLALQNSMDMTSNTSGGNIGWRKKGDPYGQAFEDSLLQSIKKDSFAIIQSNEGLHLVQITDVRIGKEKGFKLVTILEPIIPSTKTEDIVEAKATEFMAKYRTLSSLQEAVKKDPSLKKFSAYGKTINDFSLNDIMGSIAVDVIRWAHKTAKVGEVAGQVYPVSDPQNNYISKVIIPVLVSKTPKGLASIEDPSVKLEVETAVRNKKKAELIAKKLEGTTSLEAVSAKYSNAKVETASSVSYASPQVPGIGLEPRVLGTADAIAANKVSTPISGNQGVYLIQVTSKREGPAITNVDMVRKGISEKMLAAQPNQLRGVLSEVLKEKLNVKDKRAAAY